MNGTLINTLAGHRYARFDLNQAVNNCTGLIFKYICAILNE
jgi:hypothetical protein